MAQRRSVLRRSRTVSRRSPSQACRLEPIPSPRQLQVTRTTTPRPRRRLRCTVAKTTVVVTLASSAESVGAKPVGDLLRDCAGWCNWLGHLPRRHNRPGSRNDQRAGITTLTTSTLAIGSHQITASYSGDSAYSTATSAVLTQVVGKIPTVTTIVESAPAQLLHWGHLYCKRNCPKPECYRNRDLYGRHNRIRHCHS